MSTHSVTDAKNHLSELIDRARRGEGVVITRHGTPVVELRAIKAAPQPITEADIDWLAARRGPARPGVETPSQTLAALRDEDVGSRGRLIDAVRASVAAKRFAGAPAARSQDFLYGDDGLPS